MKRSLWLIFAALGLTAVAMLLRLQPETLTQAAPGVEHLPDVRVQHDFVTLAPSPAGNTLNVQERNRLARTRAVPDALYATPTLDAETAEAHAPASRKTTASRASRDETLFAKARRALVGDGRHRPEPFPRPRGNN